MRLANDTTYWRSVQLHKRDLADIVSTMILLRPTLLVAGLLLSSCAVLVQPRSGPDLAASAAQTAATIDARRTSALSKGLRDKALIFDTRVRENFMSTSGLVGRLPGSSGDLEITSHYMAAMALKAIATQDAAGHVGAHRALNGLHALEADSGHPGYLPRYLGSQSPAHANSYTQLYFGLMMAHRYCPELRREISALSDRIARHLLANDLRLLDPTTGEMDEYSDLQPRRVEMSRSRVMDCLVFLETAKYLSVDKDIQRELRIWLARAFAFDYPYRLQTSHLQLPGLKLPTHASDWLNMLRLYTLVQVGENPDYQRALNRLYASQNREHNALFAAMMGDYDQAELSLAGFPLELDNREMMNSPLPDVPEKWFPSFVKTRLIREAREPMPVYRRPLSHNEWKRNPYRLDGNIGEMGDLHYSGLDYLLAYWLVKAERRDK
ncbi:MAG: hypothetical protein ACI8W8_002764 [Rhodothermales bacterium]